MKKDYLKSNPDAKTMDNTTLKMPPKDYILPTKTKKMNNKPLNISEEAAVQMPMKNMLLA